MSASFEHYKIFYYVAKYKNITAAAKVLYLSQPTVSYAIQSLEKELNCPLFIRSKKGVTLTPEAKLLYKHVAKACAHIFKAEEELHAILNLTSGTLQIGASELALHRYLLPYLECFRHVYPDIKLTINTLSAPDAITALNAGLIDFAVIVASPYETYPELEVTELTTFQDVVVAGSKFSFLANRERRLESKQPNQVRNPDIQCYGDQVRNISNSFFSHDVFKKSMNPTNGCFQHKLRSAYIFYLQISNENNRQ